MKGLWKNKRKLCVDPMLTCRQVITSNCPRCRRLSASLRRHWRLFSPVSGATFPRSRDTGNNSSRTLISRHIMTSSQPVHTNPSCHRNVTVTWSMDLSNKRMSQLVSAQSTV